VSLRTRLTLAGGGAVFVALAIASLVIYLDVRSKLQNQVDFSLIQAAQDAAAKSHSDLPLQFGKDAGGIFQIIPNLAAVGNGGLSMSGVPVPTVAATHQSSRTEQRILSQDERVARGLARPYFRDIGFGGVAQRVYTMPFPASSHGLVRVFGPLTEANATIADVRLLLIGLTLGGALAAALLGRLAADAVLRPVRTLARTVRDVSITRDLDRRIEVTGRDELASLAHDFNTMLSALDDSQHAQQQLIADASHELRTPLAAHRANIELLARPDLPAELRQRVLAAAVRGIEELSALVGDLIQAARDGRSVDARDTLSLDELVAAAVERAERRAPGLHFESRLQSYSVVGSRSRLEHAVDNVLDNAIKWSPPGGSVHVHLADGVLTVRDHGPGIDAADLPHVFDRFYRSAAARALPGSGLGLAIVKQTIEDHAGSVAVTNADDGGAILTLQFDTKNGGA
jgi:two-component system, OmpR family, sensor histidine kinase MprB